LHEQGLRKNKEQKEQNSYAVRHCCRICRRYAAEYGNIALECSGATSWRVRERLLEINNKVEIKRPIAGVFQFLSNFENMPKWNYFVVNVKKISNGPVGINTAFRQTRKTDNQEYRIIEYEPKHKVTVETSPPYSRLRMRFTLEPSDNDNGTIVIDEWKFDTGKPALFERIAGRKVKFAVAENLEKLKQLLETGRTILQDGREERIVL
jgi:uncharacterized membrane protein